MRQGFTHDLADMLVDDLKRQLPRLQKQAEPVHGAENRDSTTEGRPGFTRMRTA